jgi:hypothetical protein
MDPELSRKNTRLGLALLALIIVLIVGSMVVAIVYNALD